jgi:cobalamin biosynthesis protein CobD/CbiB
MQLHTDRAMGLRVSMETRGRATTITIELRNLRSHQRRNAGVSTAAFAEALALRLQRVTIPPRVSGLRRTAGDASSAHRSTTPLR